MAFKSLYDYVTSEKTNDPYGLGGSGSSLKWEVHNKFALDFKKYEYFGQEDQTYLNTWYNQIITTCKEVLNGTCSGIGNQKMGEIGHFVRSFINKNLASKYGTQQYAHEYIGKNKSIWNSDGIAFLEVT